MNEYWALLSQLGLWGWVITVLCFIHYSFPDSEQFITKAAFKWGAISLCFFALWVSGMLLA
jgi:hypothetical protein